MSSKSVDDISDIWHWDDGDNDADGRWRVLKEGYVSGTVLGAFDGLLCLLFTTFLWNRFYYVPIFRWWKLVLKLKIFAESKLCWGQWDFPDIFPPPIDNGADSKNLNLKVGKTNAQIKEANYKF